MRCFIAIDIEPELKEKIGKLQDNFTSFAKLKIVEKENLHVTLKFLGETSENVLEKTKNQLSEITKNTDKFTVSVEGFGCFPSFSYIRVLWVGIKSNDLINLQEQINKTIKTGPQNSQPHLTIARVKAVSDRNGLKKRIGELDNIKIGKMAIKQIKIKKSTLTGAGPVYEDIAVYNLVS